MAIFEKKHKDQKDSGNQDDYRAPSDTGSSDEPNVVAGAGGKKVTGASADALSGSPGLPEGASTTTTTDSVVNKGAVETKGPNELDKRTPDERLKNLRGWRQKFRTASPSSADWEEFEELVGDGRSVADARRP
jgi:hypothetical protein